MLYIVYVPILQYYGKAQLVYSVGSRAGYTISLLSFGDFLLGGGRHDIEEDETELEEELSRFSDAVPF